MVFGLQRGANDLHMVQLMTLPPRQLSLHKYPKSFTFQAPTYPGYPSKEAVKQVCVLNYVGFRLEYAVSAHVPYYANTKLWHMRDAHTANRRRHSSSARIIRRGPGGRVGPGPPTSFVKR